MSPLCNVTDLRMKLLRIIANLFRRKPREKTAFEIVNIRFLNPDGTFTPVSPSLAGRCGYARLNARPIGNPSPDRTDGK